MRAVTGRVILSLLTIAGQAEGQSTGQFDVGALERTMNARGSGWRCSASPAGVRAPGADVPQGVSKPFRCSAAGRNVFGSVFDGASLGDAETMYRRALQALTVNRSVPVGGFGEEAVVSGEGGSASLMFRKGRAFVHLLVGGRDSATSGARASTARELVREIGRAIADQVADEPNDSAGTSSDGLHCDLRVPKATYRQGERVEIQYVFSGRSDFRVPTSLRREEESFGVSLRLARSDGVRWRFVRSPIHLRADFRSELLLDGEPSYRFVFPSDANLLRAVAENRWIEGWRTMDSTSVAEWRVAWDSAVTALPAGRYRVWADLPYDQLAFDPVVSRPGSVPGTLSVVRLRLRCRDAEFTVEVGSPGTELEFAL